MENTDTPNDLPLWLTEPQPPKPQTNGVVMVRYPRLPSVPQLPIPHVPLPSSQAPASGTKALPDFKFTYCKAPPIVPSTIPAAIATPVSKKRKITCPTYSDWVNGLKFFNRESDNLYTIAGTKDAIKNFTEWWE